MSFDLCNGPMTKNNAPSLKDVHVLTSRTSECGNLYGQKDFADMDKLKTTTTRPTTKHEVTVVFEITVTQKQNRNANPSQLALPVTPLFFCILRDIFTGATLLQRGAPCLW